MRRLTAAVAAAGLAIAGYLTEVHFSGAEPACLIAHGCTVVQQSAYAELGGVPVAVLGVAGYAALLITLVRDTEATRTVGAGIALAGAGFSGWLTYVEVVRLEAICAWCVASAVCMALLAMLTMVRLLDPSGSGSAAAGRDSSAAGAGTERDPLLRPWG